ncbi:MAG TPA: DUF4105 domain-containing protein, partial [bacterium]|nr:DUF4105 domain-containing protein [bacterium]
HTLLRFDQRGRGEQEHLLDYTLNFAAAVPPEDGGVAFAWKGIFGGYRGYFSVLPYYLKVLEYGDIDSRDLWEYRLSLSADQADWMLRHTWELGSTYFDYYFFRDNCSYHLLSLLEVADPTLHLREHFPLWALPSDTVRLVAEQPGLVRQVTYRASRSSLLEQKLGLLTAAEQQAVVLLIQDAQADPPGFAGWPAQRQALVLDTAADYFQLKLGANPQGDARLRAHLRALLLRRSTVRATYAVQDFDPRSSPPEVGHRSATVMLAVGAHSGGIAASAGPGQPGALDRGFVELGIQPAFHDLLSPDAGYAANSQINLGQVRARYEPQDGRLGLERLDLVNVVSLSPVDAVLHPPSWEVRAGWQRSHDGSCPGCVPFLLRAGAGLSGQVDWPRRTVGFALLDGTAEADASLATGQRSGMGPRLGLLMDVTARWRMELSAARTFFTNGQAGQTTEASVKQRVALGQNGELRLDWSSVQGLQGTPYQEAALELDWHW